MKIKDIMTTNVQYVNPQSSLNEVANQMKDLNVGSIPVCDQTTKVLGIVTDRDIVVRGISTNAQSTSSVSDVMTRNPVTVTPDTSIKEASKLMSEHQIRRLPVIEGDKLIGMVAIGDLAVRNKLANKAGDALSNISEPSRPMT